MSLASSQADMNRRTNDKNYRRGSGTLLRSEVIKIERFLKYYFLLLTSSERYFRTYSKNNDAIGTITSQGKAVSKFEAHFAIRKLIASTLQKLLYLVFLRGIALVLISDESLDRLLAATMPRHNIVSFLTAMWALFAALTYANYIQAHKATVQQLGWLEPFRVSWKYVQVNW